MTPADKDLRPPADGSSIPAMQVNASPHMIIRLLTVADASEYRELRLRALREHPDAFTSSFEEDRQRSVSWSEKRLSGLVDGCGDWVLGVFVDARLVAMLGLSIDPRRKVRHKALLFGMYVATECERKGVGRELMAACLSRAREIPGVEQLYLTVTESNTRAKAFYQNSGFREFGLERNAVKVDGRSLDKCHMVLFLESADAS
jgi:RimJ/RimL family protein N-acetyltransferase